MWQKNAIKKKNWGFFPEKWKIKTKYCLFALFFSHFDKILQIIDLDMLNFCFHLMLNLSWEVIFGVFYGNISQYIAIQNPKNHFLSLGLLSPPYPSFNGIHKVRNFY